VKEALLHLDNAITVLSRSAAAHAPIISCLERVVHAILMHDIFGVSLASEQHHIALTNWPKRDWTLGSDEPVPHYGVECVPMSGPSS
jgi:hypothetical protein